jgi:hypothetical protein
MKRTLMILLLCVLGTGLAACAVHSDRWLGDDSAAATSHGFGCGGPLMLEALAVALAFLPLSRSLPFASGPQRPQRRPVSFFQPPERSA